MKLKLNWYKEYSLKQIKMSLHYKNLALRENPQTSRAGVQWDESEDKDLMSRVRDNISLNDIALEHKRTPVAVKSRILKLALNMIEKDGMNIDEVSESIHLSSDEILKFKERRINVRQNNNKFNDDNESVKLLKEIRDYLKIISEK